MLTIENQFKRYIDNQINLDEEYAEFKEVPFNTYEELGSKGIFLTVKSGSVTYLFESNCYQILEGGDSAMYDFNFYGLEMTL